MPQQQHQTHHAVQAVPKPQFPTIDYNAAILKALPIALPIVLPWLLAAVAIRLLLNWLEARFGRPKRRRRRY